MYLINQSLFAFAILPFYIYFHIHVDCVVDWNLKSLFSHFSLSSSSFFFFFWVDEKEKLLEGNNNNDERSEKRREEKTRKPTTKDSQMHFTIIQAESCDKVKLLLFLITFYFPFFFFLFPRNSNFICFWFCSSDEMLSLIYMLFVYSQKISIN
jgi:hypothetical protein